MIKRCIGIDIGPSHLRAVQLSQTDGQLQLERVFSVQMRRNTDSPPEILKTLIKQQDFDGHADVAISMPNDAVFFRSFESDSAEAEQTQGLNKFTLEHNFPVPADEIVAQECSRRQLPDEKCSVLIAAATRTSLRERLNLFTSARIHPKLAEAAIFAVHSTIAVNHPEVRVGVAIIAYIDESHLTLAVTQDNNILIVRNIPIAFASKNNVDEQLAKLLSREAEITRRKVFGAEIEQGCKIYVAAAGGNFDGLKAILKKNLNSQMVIVNPYAEIKNPSEYNNDPAICVAEGLALRLLAPGETTGINFLDADNCNIKPALDLKKELVICVMLAAAIAAVSLSGLFMRLSHLEAKYARVKNEIREVFQHTLPEETNMVSPVAQLEQKLKALRKDYRLFTSFCPTSLSLLEVLHCITVNTPQQKNAKIDNLFIAAEAIRLSGSCNSFESVYEWQRFLQKVPEFAVVDVQDAQREPESGDVYFTMLISSVQPVVISEQN
ncbi:MAG: pilus assembly protein PilM [Planctomycetes bacterium]|nr:pilus assembly protein PilM [Planctomycetota bacterium]